MWLFDWKGLGQLSSIPYLRHRPADVWEDRDEPHWDMKLIGSHQSYACLETFLLQRSSPSCKTANMFTYVDLLNSLSGFAFALEREFLCNDQSPQRVRRERVIEDN